VTSRWFLPSLVAAAAALLVAGLGATITELGPWYHGLRQPGWAPPDMAFGPAWTLIFALTALSGLTAWRSAAEQTTRESIIGLFALNGFLNLLWSFLFFRLQRPDWAAIEVLLLWASIGALMVACRQVSRTAAILLAPYLLWVTFAAVLNFEVVRLNAPFH
jgi:tryptophan-rich sensory protein